MNWDTETDYRTTHAGAWRRGHESAAIYEGDDTQSSFAAIWKTSDMHMPGHNSMTLLARLLAWATSSEYGPFISNPPFEERKR